MLDEMINIAEKPNLVVVVKTNSRYERTKILKFGVDRDTILLHGNDELKLKISSTDVGETPTECEYIEVFDLLTATIWLRVFHEKLGNMLRAVSIETIWYAIALGKKYSFDLKLLEPWFKQWWSSQDVASFGIKGLQKVLYPCHELNHPEAFAFVTRELVYTCRWPIEQTNPIKNSDEAHKTMFLHPRIIATFPGGLTTSDRTLELTYFAIDKLNAARVAIKNELKDRVLAPLDVIQNSACNCRVFAIAEFMDEVKRAGIMPKQSFEDSAVKHMLKNLDFFDYTSAAGACKICGLDFAKMAIKPAQELIADKFQGLCITCMGSADETGHVSDSYWDRDHTSEYDHECLIPHGQTTWYYSFMGRQELMMEHEWRKRVKDSDQIHREAARTGLPYETVRLNRLLNERDPNAPTYPKSSDAVDGASSYPRAPIPQSALRRGANWAMYKHDAEVVEKSKNEPAKTAEVSNPEDGSAGQTAAATVGNASDKKVHIPALPGTSPHKVDSGTGPAALPDTSPRKVDVAKVQSENRGPAPRAVLTNIANVRRGAPQVAAPERRRRAPGADAMAAQWMAKFIENEAELVAEAKARPKPTAAELEEMTNLKSTWRQTIVAADGKRITQVIEDDGTAASAQSDLPGATASAAGDKTVEPAATDEQKDESTIMPPSTAVPDQSSSPTETAEPAATDEPKDDSAVMPLPPATPEQSSLPTETVEQAAIDEQKDDSTVMPLSTPLPESTCSTSTESTVDVATEAAESALPTEAAEVTSPSQADNGDPTEVPSEPAVAAASKPFVDAVPEPAAVASPEIDTHKSPEPVFALFVKYLKSQSLMAAMELFTDEDKAKITKIEKMGKNRVVYFNTADDRDRALAQFVRTRQLRGDSREKPRVEILRNPSAVRGGKGSKQAGERLFPKPADVSDPEPSNPSNRRMTLQKEPVEVPLPASSPVNGLTPPEDSHLHGAHSARATQSRRTGSNTRIVSRTMRRFEGMNLPSNVLPHVDAILASSASSRSTSPPSSLSRAESKRIASLLAGMGVRNRDFVNATCIYEQLSD